MVKIASLLISPLMVLACCVGLKGRSSKSFNIGTSKDWNLKWWRTAIAPSVFPQSLRQGVEPDVLF